MATHTVKKGEHLAAIAAQYGFADTAAIWDHPDNQALKDQRKDPNVLLEGDEVAIPPAREKSETGETGRHHRIRIKRPRLMLRFVVQDGVGAPIANQSFTLEVDGTMIGGETKEDGLIEQEVPAGAKKGVLEVADTRIEFEVGHLDPVEEVSGWRARLANLGYEPGDKDDPEDAVLRSAVEEFQCDAGIGVTGDLDDATLAKLREVYGS